MVLLADGLIDLRRGRWQDCLADVDGVDAIVMDPPYGAKVHHGHDVAVRHLGSPTNIRRRAARRELQYEGWTTSDVRLFVEMWAPRCCGWFVSFTSHDLVPAYEAALQLEGFYTFAPLPFFSPGSRVRLSGDGPSSWTCWMVVARPQERRFMSWGTLPGGYVFPPEGMLVVGGKPLPLMQAIIRDYTRPGDLVVDPFCGGGTTALACAIEGRRCITSEMDPVTFEKARARLSRGFTPSMFQRGPKVKAKQGSLV